MTEPNTIDNSLQSVLFHGYFAVKHSNSNDKTCCLLALAAVRFADWLQSDISMRILSELRFPVNWITT